jgi:hypothetical protein
MNEPSTILPAPGVAQDSVNNWPRTCTTVLYTGALQLTRGAEKPQETSTQDSEPLERQCAELTRRLFGTADGEVAGASL